MPDPVPIINSLGHVATRQQLLSAGCSGFDLTIAVRRATIWRIRQARYVTPGASSDAIAAARVGGMLAGTSAARSYGLWSGFDRRVHLSVGDHGSRLRTNFAPILNPERLTPDFSNQEVVVHWLVAGAVPELGPECWRVPLGTCLRQVVSWSDHETAVACLDTARTKFGLSAGKLTDLFRDAPIADRLRASCSRTGSDSGTESIVRQRLSAAGLTVEQQVAFPGMRVDMWIKGSHVLVEVDSNEFHGSTDARVRDGRRDVALLARGFFVVRLPFEQIFEDWQLCLDQLRVAIRHHP
jgi:very-short-patch-repair endonuclease